MNTAKVLTKPILKNICERLLLPRVFSMEFCEILEQLLSRIIYKS